ncbi:hypothetical protein [Sulfidibacter corallicola]|uniref:Uncharacterized protein n=1 Tax=Sulfidibacter corallicola TaxID=2818388 RepID=A0A8A4TW00_SULCO|nr:hypothetical protein [Sulfidibacter corallicola]QTD53348.1 hypothetical protein J3U87_12910 [Sulfidibacter corallicola]
MHRSLSLFVSSDNSLYFNGLSGIYSFRDSMLPIIAMAAVHTSGLPNAASGAGCPRFFVAFQVFGRIRQRFSRTEWEKWVDRAGFVTMFPALAPMTLY